MSILVNKSTRVVVQGITGREGSFHATQCKAYGTQVVAGVTPGKGGQEVEGIPVFNTVRDAVQKTRCDTSLIFVPAAFGGDAILEAADAGIRLIVCITEGIPINDMVRVTRALRSRDVRLIGPNCPGVITPDECKIGIMPGFIHKQGRVGVISRSGTLTYEAVNQLTNLGLGETTCIGIGGDPIIGTSYIELLAMFEGPGNGSDRDDRRNRRRGGGPGGRLDQSQYAKAGGGLHRRDHGASRPPHGPCRRDYHGWEGHSRRKDGGVGSGRRPRLPESC